MATEIQTAIVRADMFISGIIELLPWIAVGIIVGSAVVALLIIITYNALK